MTTAQENPTEPVVDNTTAAPVRGEGVGQYTEADIPGYYHLVTSGGGALVAFDFYPTYKDGANGALVPVDADEAEWAYLNLRVRGH